MRLNLARQWRSKRFDELIGQELTMRLVKNSLFKGILAPVYLLSGARGCGKTTVGRLFAAAVNCAQLEAFQANPQQVALPCLTCTSCIAMTAGNHPDFIEIDAASYTGVDHVRTIIEAATLLPVMGRKKIYLIDEAHMLSKAAFNAFLKLLEEPPKTVMFFLATTEMNKILETVRSRCFHLFFEPLSIEQLSKHLETICLKESITFEPQALALIAQESGGCVRDALNHLERIRLLNQSVTITLVRSMLGHIDDDSLLQLFERIADGNGMHVYTSYKEHIAQYSPMYVWQRIVDLLIALVWAHSGVIKDNWQSKSSDLNKLSKRFAVSRLLEFIDSWTATELIVSKSGAQHLIIEQQLLLMVTPSTKTLIETGERPKVKEPVVVTEPKQPAKVVASPTITKPESVVDNRWQNFTASLAQLQDPLLQSVFQQVQFIGIDAGKVSLEIGQDFAFFKDILLDSRKAWFPLLQQAFETVNDVVVTIGAQKKTEFIKNSPMKAPLVVPPTPVHAPVNQVVHKSTSVQKPFVARQKQYSVSHKSAAQREIAIDIKDQQQWPKAHLILRYFPGTVTEIKESSHE
jgi:DNA polymerase-3 subunit gamma/tau